MGSAKFQKAKELNVPVVTENWLKNIIQKKLL
jgi:hypothetical protein